MSDRSLIQSLWTEHRLALQAFFRRRPASRCDAVDLTQEVYLRLLRASDEREIANPEAYLFTVARNLLAEHAVAEKKQAQRGISHGSNLLTDLVFESNLDRQLDHVVQVDALREAVKELNEAQQAALVMAYWHDMSYAQIAKELNVHRSMVGKYIVQALNVCRKRLRQRALR